MVQGNAIEYPIRRSGRRTIGLSIEADGSLLITAPTRATRKDIDEVVLGKARWIARHLGKIAIQPPAPTLRYVTGERVLYRGAWLTLQVGEVHPESADNVQLDLFAPPPAPVASAAVVTLRESSVHVADGPDVREQLAEWYWREAHRLIVPRVQMFAALVGRPVSRIRITAPERQWGGLHQPGHHHYELATGPGAADAAGLCRGA